MHDTNSVVEKDRNTLRINKSQLELAVGPDAWPAGNDGRSRVLLVALNAPGYYSLPVRILTLMVHESDRLPERFDARYVEAEIRTDLSPLLESIVAWRPDLVGFSVNIWNREFVSDIMPRIRSRLPEVCLLAGGQEMTNSLVDFLGDIPALDYVVDGEGEIPFRQFLGDWNPKTRRLDHPEAVSGLRYRDGEEHRFTRPAEILESLDEIPSPILAGLVPILEKNYLGVLIEGTRGCPFRCAFCFEGGKRCKVRTMSIERLKEEVEFMAGCGAESFHMMDPILCNSNPERLRRVAQIFRDASGRRGKVYLVVEAYGDQITDEVAECLNDVAMVDVGLQSTNPETIRAIHRPYQPKKFVEGLARLRKTNATINLYLISGLPFETIETFLKGIRFALDQQPTRIFLNELYLLNGTELRQRAEEYGYEFDPHPPYLARRNRWINAREMALIQSFSMVVFRRHNLSARSISFALPWMPKPTESRSAAARIVLGGRCSWKCPGCRFGAGQVPPVPDSAVADRIQHCAGQNVVLVAGDGYPMQNLLRLAAQFHFVGASRIKLAAPLTLIPDKQTVQSLLNCGIWYVDTFVDVRNIPGGEPEIMQDPSFREAFEKLKWLNWTYRLKQRGEIRPFVDVTLLSNARDFAAIRNVVCFVGRDCSVVGLPGLATADSVAWIAGGDDARFREVINSRFWVRFTEPAMRGLLRETKDLDEVIGHLRALDLLSSGAVRPPCYEAE